MILYIENNRGQKAFVGSKVLLDSLDKNKYYTITDIDSIGIITLDNCIDKSLSSVRDFKVVG